MHCLELEQTDATNATGLRLQAEQQHLCVAGALLRASTSCAQRENFLDDTVNVVVNTVDEIYLTVVSVLVKFEAVPSSACDLSECRCI